MAYLITAPVRALGRLGLGAMFIQLGLDAARRPGARVEMAARLGMPMPDIAVRANGAAMAALGATMSLGIRPRLSAAGLALLMVPTTWAGHAFWKDTDPAVRAGNRVQFLKNVALAGGLLEVAGTPGRPRRATPGATGRMARTRAKAEVASATSRARADEAASLLWEKAAAAVG